jgi:hypothetical protein
LFLFYLHSLYFILLILIYCSPQNFPNKKELHQQVHRGVTLFGHALYPLADEFANTVEEGELLDVHTSGIRGHGVGVRVQQHPGANHHGALLRRFLSAQAHPGPLQDSFMLDFKHRAPRFLPIREKRSTFGKIRKNCTQIREKVGNLEKKNFIPKKVIFYFSERF